MGFPGVIMKMNRFTLILILFMFSNALAAETIDIPVFYNQLKTPVASYVSAEDVRGAQIAADELNASGGILGKKVKILDIRALNLIEAVEKAEKVAADPQIPAVVGANISKMSLVIAPVFQKAKIPMITPISTNPMVTETGDYIFRACFIDPFQGQVMANFAINTLNAKTAVILTKTNSLFSKGLSSVFNNAFSKKGRVIWVGNYLSTDADFREMLTKLKELNPDVVFVPGHGKDVGFILKQSYDLKIKSIFLGGDGWGKGALGIAGAEAAEGHFFVNHWHVNVDTQLSKTFRLAYRNKFGDHQIAASAALSYDAVMLIAEAMKSTGSMNRSDIRNAIAKTDRFAGVTGKYTFDKQGDPVDKDAVILGYKNGEIVYVKTVKP